MRLQKGGTGIPSFPPNFEGELPPPRTQEELRRQLEERCADIPNFPVKEFLDFLVKEEEKSYEVPDGFCYHRQCGGGAMVVMKTEEGLEEYCANCSKIGKLPIFSFPESRTM